MHKEIFIRRTHIMKYLNTGLIIGAAIILAAAFFSGYGVIVVDRRVSREELAQAFQQRDKALETIAAKIKDLDSRVPAKLEEKKK
jgi:hypothetical protein